jgi:hypothetical protein
MRKLLLSVLGMLAAAGLSAQVYPYVDINQISFVSQQDLQNCNDSSLYLGDTVVTRGIVVTSGNLSEVSSGSVQGGSRPFIALVDTAYDGVAPAPFQGVTVMGAYDSGGGNLVPNADIESSLAGDIIELTCIVTEYAGLVQLQPVDANAVTFVGSTTAPTFKTIQAGDIQDNQRQNILPTGEQWEGAYVELQNVTVTSVSIFSGGSRCEFTVADANGNQVLVADRFLPTRLAGISTVNPNSPKATGDFVAPSVGTVFNHIRGIIFQDENGCAGGGSFAGGYEINPFLDTDMDKAASPPSITGVTRNPMVPNASQSVTVTADIVDNDGVVVSATLFYAADQTAPTNLFTSVTMSNTGGSTYSATIPAFPLDSIVRYYIEAVDDSSKISTSPANVSNETHFYTVRPNGPTIMDIQFVPDVADGDSKIEGDTITVTGIVTASYQAGDLGYLYIQDPVATEFAGIFVEGGPLSVFGFSRGDEVTIQGVVAEQYGFTTLQAITATATGNTGTITPVVLDPSDPALFGSNNDELEKYESMLIRFENPAIGGTVNVTDGNIGFGEYTVGSGMNATVDARVLAGRQSGTSAQSSLDVSYISDTAAYGAGLNVTPVQVDTTFSMDALEGMMYYSFSNFKLTPRNNADFDNLIVFIAPIYNSEVETAVYPNPAQDRIAVQIDENYQFDNVQIEVLDITGRVALSTQTALSLTSLNLGGLEKGVYVVRVTNNNELIHSSKMILK